MYIFLYKSFLIGLIKKKKKFKPMKRIINLRAAVYYRVSKKAKNNIKMQKSICKDYCSKRGVKIIKEYYDIGVSGRSKNRPGLKKMLNEIGKKQINSILVYKIDRLGRDFSQLSKLFDSLEERGISLISATQNFDRSTPEGMFMLRILMGLAEFESGIISKRIIDGLTAKKSS